MTENRSKRIILLPALLQPTGGDLRAHGDGDAAVAGAAGRDLDCNAELARSPGHPFYQRLNGLFDEERFDAFVEEHCRKFYVPTMGRPGLVPRVYLRSLLIGYFEGIDHSTISRTRRLIDVETHREVFSWVLARLADRRLIQGKRVGN